LIFAGREGGRASAWGFPLPASGAAMAAHNAHITDNIVRAGVNYSFF
jgi:hypothetical protein